MTSGFHDWLKENYPDEWRTFELLDEYWMWVSAPLNKLRDDCPWIKDKDYSIDSDSVHFTKMEIKELIDKGYTINVSTECDKSAHYECSCMPYTYSIEIRILKNDSEIVNYYGESSESFDYVLTNFYPFEDKEEVDIYERD